MSCPRHCASVCRRPFWLSARRVVERFAGSSERPTRWGQIQGPKSRLIFRQMRTTKKKLRKDATKVPKGRLNSAQDAILGQIKNLIKSRRDGWKPLRCGVSRFQPSLRDYSYGLWIPRTDVLG